MSYSKLIPEVRRETLPNPFHSDQKSALAMLTLGFPIAFANPTPMPSYALEADVEDRAADGFSTCWRKTREWKAFPRRNLHDGVVAAAKSPLHSKLSCQGLSGINV